ncbi:MAG: hypothetical protein M3143_05150 [Actinomycetota bacterium]|nr:hypothetical protein [Actinomycetota bacterium]
MNAAAKLGGFALVAGLMFGGTYGIGRLTGPVGAAPDTAHGSSQHGAAPTPASAELPAGGLMVAQDGYRVDLISGHAAAGTPEDFAFRIVDPHGAPVTSFTPTHDKPLHLIVVRRDLTGFQHLHPEMGADGTWRIPLTFPTAGDYRAFVDFTPRGQSEAITLGADVAVAGAYTPAALPTPARTVTIDGYTVRLDGDLVPGRTNELTFTVSKAGQPVTDLQPYLAAYGHLVALRHGDLAYLHVHPDGQPGDGRTGPGPRITFFATVPSVGNYGLFLDFRHEGVVRTVAFPATVTATTTATDAGRPHDDPEEK